MDTAAQTQWLEALLAPRIKDRGQSFVFPSQSVADAWALEAPLRFGLKTVECGRFLGWDRFRDEALAAKGRGKQADDFVHMVWAAGIVARQRERPFLRRIAGPGKPSEAFVPFFAKLPPSLEKAGRAIGRTEPTIDRAGPAGDETLSDLLLLRDDYAAFMERHGLFEPAWESISMLPGEGGWLIIAPELMEDFAGFRPGLERLAPRVSLCPLPAAKEGLKDTILYKFANSYEEIRWAFLEIGRLLDEGVPPGEIAVTAADLEAARPYIARAAALAGVPAAVKGGSPLAASPFGRLLKEIGEASASGFDFEPLRTLLLDRFANWKQAGAARGLLDFGIERHAYASYSSKGTMVDIWEASFASAPGSQGIRDFYRELTKALRCIASASSFSNLRIAIVAFRKRFLDESGWSETEEREIERAMVELDGLAKAEREYADEGGLLSPFGLFLKALETTTYVPQGASSGGASVPVYPYRVSALHPARHHFVLGASQEGISVAYSGLPFLREDQKARLGSPDSDASPDFAAAYAASARGTVFSYAEESFSGWSVPHPWFARRAEASGNGNGNGSPRLPGNFAALRSSCPLASEAAAWRGECGLPERLLGAQIAAFDSALPSLRAPASRFAKARASAVSLGALLPRITRQDGLLRASATMLKEYSGCPFAWLLARGLRLEEEASGIGFFDALLAGDMAHAALRVLLADMGRLGPIEARHREAYSACVKDSLASVLPGFEAKEGPFLVPMFEAYAPLLGDRLERLVDALVEDPGWEAGKLEEAFERAYPGLGAVLEGRIDRLARLAESGSHEIIDYKKRTLPRKESLKSTARAAAEQGGEAQAGELGDYQMPAYVALCEAAGLKVEAAAYWSIEDAKWLKVMGPEAEVAGTRAEYAPEMAAFEAALGRVLAAMRQGDFRPSGGDTGACEGCGWKAVCRTRYATE